MWPSSPHLKHPFEGRPNPERCLRGQISYLKTCRTTASKNLIPPPEEPPLGQSLDMWPSSPHLKHAFEGRPNPKILMRGQTSYYKTFRTAVSKKTCTTSRRISVWAVSGHVTIFTAFETCFWRSAKSCNSHARKVARNFVKKSKLSSRA